MIVHPELQGKFVDASATHLRDVLVASDNPGDQEWLTNVIDNSRRQLLDIVQELAEHVVTLNITTDGYEGRLARMKAFDLLGFADINR